MIKEEFRKGQKEFKAPDYSEMDLIGKRIRVRGSDRVWLVTKKHEASPPNEWSGGYTAWSAGVPKWFGASDIQEIL
jgi:hypothetical protein